MSTCLITKLQGTATDNSLIRLGAAAIKFQISATYQKGLYLIVNANSRIICDKTVTFTIDGTQASSVGTTFETGDARKNVFIKPNSINEDVLVQITHPETAPSLVQIGTDASVAVSKLEIVKGWNLGAMTAFRNPAGSILDLSMLKDANNLSAFISRDRSHVQTPPTVPNKVVGDLSVFYGHTFSDFALEQSDASQVVGDLDQLLQNCNFTSTRSFRINNIPGGGSTNYLNLLGASCTTISITGMTVSGALEPFLQDRYTKQVANITMTVANGMTLNGNVLGDGTEIRIAYSSGVLTVKNAQNTMIASYNGSAWTYA